MSVKLRYCLVGIFSLCLGINAATAEDLLDPMETVVTQTESQVQLQWHRDYLEAMEDAKRQRKMLLIFFHNPGNDAARLAFEERTLTDPQVVKSLADYVLAKLPVDVEIKVRGEQTRLLEHAAFEPMDQSQGLAVVDMKHKGETFYGRVTSAFAFPEGRYYAAEKMRVILALPAGTLTQRTMIFAVRMHPERPESTTGTLSTVLSSEAESHSMHQASIRLQGHHNWNSRFHSINGRLPQMMMAQEVVAESWPRQRLVDAAIECVHSWRQSPGHWSAVRRAHSLFGYDMKLGENGVWYATGIFADER